MPNDLALRPRQLTALAVVVGVLGLHAWLLAGWSPATGRDGGPSLKPSRPVVRSLWVKSASPVAAPGVPQAPEAVMAVKADMHRVKPDATTVNATRPSQEAIEQAHGVARDLPKSDPAVADADGEGLPPSGTDGLAPAQAPPTYATRTPEPVRLRYALQLGVGAAARSGEAVLSWQHDGDRYRLALTGDDRGLPLITQVSSGSFDAAGLAPERFVDQRRGRRVHAANFQRDSGRISFSGPRIEYPSWPGAQDRLGWVVQLAAIAQAAGRVPPEVAMFVVDGRGAGDVWTLTEQGTETIDTPMGPVAAVKLLRQPQRLHDWRVEAWLDPQRGFWPARLRMTLARSGAVFELTLQGE